jgi:hypothetical protein
MLNDIWLGTLEVAGSVTSFTVGVYDAVSFGLYSKTVEAAGAGESWGESLAMFPVSNRLGHTTAIATMTVTGAAGIARGGVTLVGAVGTSSGLGGGGVAIASTGMTISATAAAEGAAYAGGGLILLAAGSESASNGPRGGKGKPLTERHREHLRESDLRGAQKEQAGGTSGTRPDGMPWQHLKEVQDSMRGLRNGIIRIKNQLCRELPPWERRRLEEELAKASDMLDRARKWLEQ